VSVPLPKTHAATPPGEVDRLLGWMPVIVGSGPLLPWDRKFCASIIRRAQGGRFQPSAKQILVMQRIVRAWCRANLRAQAGDPAPRMDLPFGRIGTMGGDGREDGDDQGCGGKS
jgi:hypothetical protein